MKEMSKEKEIKHKKIKDTRVATARLNLKDRDELYAALGDVKRHIPEEHIAGPGFCIFQFITSVKQGFDAEVGFPVTRAVEAGEVKTRMIPGMQVLSLIHKGPADDLGGSYKALYGYAAELGLISDEFCLEVYPDLSAEGRSEIEIQFVIHKWDELLATNVDRVLGEEAARQVMQGEGTLTVMSPVEERFRWVKGAVRRLEGLADKQERYDILSSCAHVFPESQLDKLRVVYEETKARTGNGLEAVDAVITFMDEDPGWGVRPRREGNAIYSTKKPRDPEGYEKAESELERRKAYCYCPLVREHLEEGMPVTFCYCGAGWFRQQWEAAIGEPVTVEILSSVLKGDDVCEFAIRLPDAV
jgi:effector-binding domain-containing protein